MHAPDRESPPFTPPMSLAPTGQWSSTYHSAFATLAKSNQMARSPLSLSWLRTRTRSIEFVAFPGSGLTLPSSYGVIRNERSGELRSNCHRLRGRAQDRFTLG